MKKIKGRPVSTGIAIGRAMLYLAQNEIVLKEKIAPEMVEREIWRLGNAIKKTHAQLKKINQDMQKVMGHDMAQIIESQCVLLNDSALINDIKKIIKTKLVKTEWAVKEIENKYIELFSSIRDLSFKERRNDISDVLNRILGNLKKSSQVAPDENENLIIVADDIPPSEAAKLMSRGKLQAIVLNKGGETSHTVILSRSLGIPALLETGNATEMIHSDDQLIVDGLSGEVIINPSKTILAECLIKKNKFQLYKDHLQSVSQLPNVTKDNHAFHLFANIELPLESDIAHSSGAQGIGLFRTEFLYLDANGTLSEDDQYMIYKNMAQKIYPHPLVIRTFDLGRDKADPHMHAKIEENPSLGMMAVRMFLKKKDVFKKQIRAILRANHSGNISILFPMISEIEEVHSINELIDIARLELSEKGLLPRKEIKKGIMIEIPAAVKIIKYLRDEVDFFSIGTNDLIQYLLAVDRNNSDVAYLFSPFHPGVIGTLQEIYHEITAIGKEVTVCGEMAGHCFPALMLLGMGYTNFSMNPLAVVEIKRIFTNVHFAYLKTIVKQLIAFSSRQQAEEFITESLLKKYPRLFIRQHLM